jgi:hypothetical protein
VDAVRLIGIQVLTLIRQTTRAHTAFPAAAGRLVGPQDQGNNPAGRILQVFCDLLLD